MGAVVQDRHDRAGRAGQRLPRRTVEDAPGRRRGRRVEALAGQRDRVRQEPGELPQVLRAAVRQVRVRLGHDAARHRRQLHELGVRLLLAAEHDRGHPAGQDGVQAVRPGPAPAQDADHDGGGTVDQRRHVRGREAGRIAEPVAGAARAGGQQVGIRGGEQNDHDAGSLLQDPASLRDRASRRSVPDSASRCRGWLTVARPCWIPTSFLAPSRNLDGIRGHRGSSTGRPRGRRRTGRWRTIRPCPRPARSRAAPQPTGAPACSGSPRRQTAASRGSGCPAGWSPRRSCASSPAWRAS